MIRSVKMCTLICLMALASCDNSIDYFRNINQAPLILVYKDGQELTELNDSIKIDYSRSYEYSVNDEEIVELRVLEPSEGLAVTIDKKEFTLTALQQGVHQVVVGSKDGFGELAVFPIHIVVYHNLLPVCKMGVVSIGRLEIEIDLSKSYDRDAHFGGQIIRYEYDIDGYSFLSTFNQIHHIFGSGGIKNISARVQDNNNEWSPWVTVTIDIK